MTALVSFLVTNPCVLYQQMTLHDAHTLALKVLKQVMEEKLDAHNVQLSQASARCLPLFSRIDLESDTFPSHVFQVTKDKGFEILDEARLSTFIEAM